MDVVSICPYCGCGCRLCFVVDGGRIAAVRPVEEEVSRGRPCVKGLSCHEPVYKKRIVQPLLRERKDAPLRPASWEEAFAFIKQRTTGLGPEEVAFTGSGEFSNEDNYLLSKLARVVFKTNNVDCCARLCHATTAWALNKTLGIKAMPSNMDDVLDCDVIIAAGTNPASNYPVLFNRVLEARQRGAYFVSVQAEPNETCSIADFCLIIHPEGIDVFLGGLINTLLEKASSEQRAMPGFAEMAESVKHLTPEYTALSCRIRLEDFLKVVSVIEKAERLAVLWGMGLTQHSDGTQNALAAIDLGLLKNARLVPMRGKVNVQGAVDVGSCPDFKCLAAVQELWQTAVSAGEGKKLPEVVFDERVKAFFVMGMNPAQSMPDLNSVHEKLRKSFVVLFHHHWCLTADFADVVLPAALLFEQEGTITNAERRVRHAAKVVEPPAGRPNWKTLCELASFLGFADCFAFKNADEVFAELAKAVPEYAELSWQKIVSGDAFAFKEPRFKRFAGFKATVDPLVSDEYPFILSTARLPLHFCTGELTLNTQKLVDACPEPYCSISAQDAEKLGLKDGDAVRIASECGEVTLRVRVHAEMTPGVVLVPYHFDTALVNRLVPSGARLDTVTQTPSYKAVVVKIQKSG